MTKVNETTEEVKIEYVLRDACRLAPVENAQPVGHLRRARTTPVACFPVGIEMRSKLIAFKYCVGIINYVSFSCALLACLKFVSLLCIKFVFVLAKCVR